MSGVKLRAQYFAVESSLCCGQLPSDPVNSRWLCKIVRLFLGTSRSFLSCGPMSIGLTHVARHYAAFCSNFVDTLHAQPAPSAFGPSSVCLRSATAHCHEYRVLIIRDTVIVVTNSRTATPYQIVPWKYSTHLMNIMTPGTLVIPYPWLTMRIKGKLIPHADPAFVEMWADLGWSLTPTISFPVDPATGCLPHGMCSRRVRLIGDSDCLVFRFDNPGSVFTPVPPSVGWILGGRGCGADACPEEMPTIVFTPGETV
ncbi:hypothetical protein EIP86_011092 [Pleurotus ostreatoroseus]|nr:hypothetical protein EIP86_011092 [Pleurotus ostreatoroseus]